MSEWELKKAKKKPRPPRTILFGEPKIGKSTFASNAPGVVFIPTEDGISGLDVMQLPSDGVCHSWEDVLKAIRVLLETDHDRKWVALDTINGVADLCAKHVCDRDFGGNWESRKGQEGFNAWGRGDKAAAQEFKRLLSGLDMLREKKGMGCILLAHQGLQRSGNALGEDFQKFTADIHKNSWSLLVGWADHIAHACRDYMVHVPQGKEDSGKGVAKEMSTTRWLVFEGGPGRDAGARAGYDMPDRIELSWSTYADNIAKHFK